MKVAPVAPELYGPLMRSPWQDWIEPRWTIFFNCLVESHGNIEHISFGVVELAQPIHLITLLYFAVILNLILCKHIDRHFDVSVNILRQDSPDVRRIYYQLTNSQRFCYCPRADIEIKFLVCFLSYDQGEL